MQQYPKWLRHPGEPDVLVPNEDAERDQMAAWAEKYPVSETQPRQHPLDHDGDGKPGGSLPKRRGRPPKAKG